MFRRLLTAEGRGPAAFTVEVFGWIILAEGAVMLLAPELVGRLLHLPAFVPQGANYFRLIGLIACGVGILYVSSGRLNAEGFVFASMLDRPLAPPAMAVMWWLGVVPGPLALGFALQDFVGFLWTLSAWRAERRGK